jgi:hypothetical protein
MIHLAESGFYEEVTKRLRNCDLIVAEGVGHTAGISALMLAYRGPPGSAGPRDWWYRIFPTEIG